MEYLSIDEVISKGTEFAGDVLESGSSSGYRVIEEKRWILRLMKIFCR